ncbi:MAG: di-trans,poly-cis-decaprenylcistransferase [Gammaproteobacteria bacterium RIFCSPHIGHO2_12_FULL_41_15]|nr:MAG: di-trans,poly-cis-decaprenylcistransferase [Gammaproteobacteria bacterium RIFCSPHIGHO2_12_FULL_41_15]
MKKPRHVAIVMDGNGRWAQQRGLPRAAGHRAGLKSLREIVRVASDMGIDALTVFAFSTENWGRPRFEIKHLTRLLVEGLKTFVDELHEKNVRMSIIGKHEAFGKSIAKKVDEVLDRTQFNTGLHYTVAINYSGRTDIVYAVQAISNLVQQGELSVDEIDERIVSQFVGLHNLPPVDLLIRTGGEKRISNFLLWQIAYSELYFSDLLWPDFGESAFNIAIKAFDSRERRFGKTSEQVQC